MKENMDGIKTNKLLLGGVVAAVIVIALIVVFGGNGEGDRVVRDNEKSEETAAPSEDREDTMALSQTQPIESGDYQYEFSGIEWIFDTESEDVAGTGATHVKMMFADFTRNGNAITFGRPYKLGIHPGTCQNSSFEGDADVDGLPIAYATCSDGETTRDFLVVQRAEHVVVLMNETKGEEESGFSDWYQIDVTDIVR